MSGKNQGKSGSFEVEDYGNPGFKFLNLVKSRLQSGPNYSKLTMLLRRY